MSRRRTQQSVHMYTKTHTHKHINNNSAEWLHHAAESSKEVAGEVFVEFLEGFQQPLQTAVKVCARTCGVTAPFWNMNDSALRIRLGYVSGLLLGEDEWLYLDSTLLQHLIKAAPLWWLIIKGFLGKQRSPTCVCLWVFVYAPSALWEIWQPKQQVQFCLIQRFSTLVVATRGKILYSIHK